MNLKRYTQRVSKYTLGDSIRRWVKDIESSRRYWDHPQYLEVRYENLVSHPRPVLEKIMDLIEEPWDENMLNYSQVSRPLSKLSGNPRVREPLKTTSVDRWQKDLSDDEKRLVKRIGGDLLVELGYAQDKQW
jgi:hypothetical protein